MSAAAPPIAVGVFPSSEHERLQRLLGALEEAFPVRFEGRRSGELGDLDAVLEIGGEPQAEAAAAAGIPALSLLVPEPMAPGAAVTQALTADPLLDGRLREAPLPDTYLGAALDSGSALDSGAAPRADAGVSVLARCREQPTWVAAGRRQTALLSPAELGPDGALRERLCDGRSAALLPLVHFLRQITAAVAWRPPPARASLLFDDPNLHWPSYGFVKLRALAQHARAHSYHAALATVPLDGWFAHPAAVRAMKESRGSLSLLVHGNDHYGAELGQVESEQAAVALAAQALRRLQPFQRRTGIRVDPVMVPPHEECSEATVRGLRRCGFEAISMTRPFPWLARPPRTWLARPEGVGPLVGWRPLDHADGLPILVRHPFVGRSAAELALRSFLDQPLVLYGHQADLRDGLELLASTAADVNRLGPTRWCSLGEIAAGSYETRQQGPQLSVRPLARRCLVEVPDGVEQLLVEAPVGEPERQDAILVDGRPQAPGEPIGVTPGTGVEVTLRAGDELDVAAVPAPRRQPLALPRRVLSEGRDRMLPLLSRSR